MKNKEIEYNRQHFIQLFNKLTSDRHGYTAWSDTITLFALSIINPLTLQIFKEDEKLNKLWNAREKRYLQIINTYPKDKQQLFPEMFACIVNEFTNNPYQDLLGSIYMELGISNNKAGQFFTPYSLCEMMAQMTVDKPLLRKQVKEIGWCTINDPSCGGGATLISGVEQCDRLFNRLNWQNHVLVVANDIDKICAYMCYIQLSLIGVAGIVTISDTLTTPEVDFYQTPDKVLFTPTYLSDVWTMRRLFHSLDLNMKKCKGIFCNET